MKLKIATDLKHLKITHALYLVKAIGMLARVLNFRQGRHTQKTNQLLLSVKDVTSRKAVVPFVGKKVIWKTKSGREIVGKVAGPHGNSGVMRARFSKGVSGEVLGKDLEIKS